MGQVVSFRRRKEDELPQRPANNDTVKVFVDNTPLGVDLEKLLDQHGIEIKCETSRKHFKTLVCMMNSMKNRAKGNDAEGVSLYLDCLGEVLGYNEEVKPSDNDPFADLLGQLDNK